MVKVTDPENKKPSNKPGEAPDDRLSSPEPVMVYKEPREDGLNAVYINMDCTALLNCRSSLKTAEAISVAEKRYFSAVYFHTLFLFAITKNRKYSAHREANDAVEESAELTEYISDLFTNAYAQFLLSFDTQELISALEA
ncbi:MAG: hypothetical protein V7676_05455 [Parasphingorhabdus sp.]|uniref:hypothetical protein n=1 Tax=Parasphingorhabdus sp. TaxID=2709688 RepID=UPI003001E77C